MKQNEQKINETLNYIAGYDDEENEDFIYEAEDKAEAFDLIIAYFDQKMTEINEKIDMITSKQFHQFCKIKKLEKTNEKQMNEAVKIMDDTDVRYEAFEMLVDYIDQRTNELNNKLDILL